MTSVFEIRRCEFLFVDPGARFDPEPDPRPHRTLDGNCIELHRNVSLVEQRMVSRSDQTIGATWAPVSRY